MAAPYLGGIAITHMEWMSQRALRVLFSTTYGNDYHYQVYAGRSLAGITTSTSDRAIIADVDPGDWPQEIQLLAVDPDEQFTDYGEQLPPRPYNVAKLAFTCSGWPTDTAFIEVAAGPAPGEAVDEDNIVGRTLFDENRAYTVLTDPLEGTGEWNLEIAGRDDSLPDGNRGTAAAVSVDIYAHPPDVLERADGTRFGYSVDAGVLTVSFEEPE